MRDVKDAIAIVVMLASLTALGFVAINYKPLRTAIHLPSMPVPHAAAKSH